jgi:hypothetical protein
MLKPCLVALIAGAAAVEVDFSYRFCSSCSCRPRVVALCCDQTNGQSTVSVPRHRHFLAARTKPSCAPSHRRFSALNVHIRIILSITIHRHPFPGIVTRPGVAFVGQALHGNGGKHRRPSMSSGRRRARSRSVRHRSSIDNLPYLPPQGFSTAPLFNDGAAATKAACGPTMAMSDVR